MAPTRLKEPPAYRGSSRCKPEAPRPPRPLLYLAEQAPATVDGGLVQLVPCDSEAGGRHCCSRFVLRQRSDRVPTVEWCVLGSLRVADGRLISVPLETQQVDPQADVVGVISPSSHGSRG